MGTKERQGEGRKWWDGARAGDKLPRGERSGAPPMLCRVRGLISHCSSDLGADRSEAGGPGFLLRMSPTTPTWHFQKLIYHCWKTTCRAFYTSLCCFVWRHWCNYTSIQDSSKPFFFFFICLILCVERFLNTGLSTLNFTLNYTVVGRYCTSWVFCMQLMFRWQSVSPSSYLAVMSSWDISPIDHKLRVFVNQTLH